MSEKRRSGGIVEENLVLGDRSHMGIKGEVAAASLDVNVTAPLGPVMFDPPQTKVWEDTRDGGNSPWSSG